MRALTLSNLELTPEALRGKVEEMQGAGIGIRIAALLLMLEGWSSSQIAELFGLSRRETVKLIQKANINGLGAITDLPRPGRPPRLGEEVIEELGEALSRPPQDYGLFRKQWDGNAVVEYLRKSCGITIHVRHAQRMLKKLGFSAGDDRKISHTQGPVQG